MSDLFLDAMRRIQELEKELQATTKRAEDAEYSVKALRANAKQAKLNVSTPLNDADIKTFAARVEVPNYMAEHPDEITLYADRLKRMIVDGIADHILDNGYLGNITFTQDHNDRANTTYVTGSINLY